ncbi:hypothetical protein HWV62_12739 [Athelia sp. TMB]|nr:hypothetical protein HWV62_12739 [Athelia sp. TMB]
MIILLIFVILGTCLSILPHLQDLKISAEETSASAALDKLPYAENASWNPDLACLPGTRVAMLDNVHNWIRDVDGKGILLLRGVVGSGKTTIAHSVAQKLHEDGFLASSFFFDRSNPHLNTSKIVLSKIARDLAGVNPHIRREIVNALNREPELATASLSRQFEPLILAPLRRHPPHRPLVVVIDALDESLDTALLDILDKEAQAPRMPRGFRIFVSSRPTKQSFFWNEDIVTILPIDTDSPQSRRDIETYVDVKMPNILSLQGQEWSDDTLIQDLKSATEGSFIWIATVYEFLRRTYNPRGTLENLLSKYSPNLPAERKMDELYASILEESGYWDDKKFLQDYALIMGAIVVSKQPLSLAALQALYGEAVDLSVQQLLQHFGSVVTGYNAGGGPIRIIHESLREFITTRACHNENTRKFFISETSHNSRTAELCMNTVNKELLMPMFGAEHLSRSDTDPSRRSRLPGPSEQLTYCCEYWNYHISNMWNTSRALDEFLLFSTSDFHGSLFVRYWLQHNTLGRQLYEIGIQPSISLSWANRRTDSARYTDEESFLVDQYSVSLYSGLAAKNLTRFTNSLASSLSSLSIRLYRLGLWTDDLEVIEALLRLNRALVVQQPEKFNETLMSILNKRANRLSDLNRHKEALAAIQEVVRLRRAFAQGKSSPSIIHDLAQSLNHLYFRYLSVSDHASAFEAIQEAVKLYRTLAQDDPSTFTGDLVLSLNDLSHHLADLGRRGDALDVIREALDLLSDLAAELAVGNYDGEARQTIQDSVTLYRDDLKVCLKSLLFRNQAEIVHRERMELQRLLVREMPPPIMLSLTPADPAILRTASLLTASLLYNLELSNEKLTHPLRLSTIDFEPTTCPPLTSTSTQPLFLPTPKFVAADSTHTLPTPTFDIPTPLPTPTFVSDEREIHRGQQGIRLWHDWWGSSRIRETFDYLHGHFVLWARDPFA